MSDTPVLSDLQRYLDDITMTSSGALWYLMKILKKHERHRPKQVVVKYGSVRLINEQEGERRRSIEHSNTRRRIYTLEFWSQRRERIRTAPGLGLSFSSSSPRLLSSSSALFTSLCSLFSSLVVTRYFNISYFNHFNFNLVFSGGLAWIEISVLSRARVHLIGLVRNETFITCQQKLAVWFSQRAPRHHADQRYRCFERSEGERRDWST